MKIIKILNNNSVLASDPSEKQETILIGKGIAFGKKSGDTIDEAKASKKYILEGDEESKRLIQLIQEIPVETIKIASRIVEQGQQFLSRPISANIEIAITDHIHYALIRLKKGLVFKNYMLWEIKRFYPNEYEAAKKAIQYVNERYQAGLPEEEASFIALHFINDTYNGNLDHMVASTKLIQEIINLIQYHFQIQLDTESLSYHRFITHLRFFAGKLVSHNLFGEADYYLYDFMRLKYKEIFQCALKINTLAQKEYNIDIRQEELAYLMVHIERVLHDVK